MLPSYSQLCKLSQCQDILLAKQQIVGLICSLTPYLSFWFLFGLCMVRGILDCEASRFFLVALSANCNCCRKVSKDTVSNAKNSGVTLSCDHFDRSY